LSAITFPQRPLVGWIKPYPNQPLPLSLTLPITQSLRQRQCHYLPIPTYTYLPIQRTRTRSECVNEACTSALNPGMERTFSCAFNLDAFPVSIINLMFHSKRSTTNSTIIGKRGALSGFAEVVGQCDYVQDVYYTVPIDVCLFIPSWISSVRTER